MKSNDICVIRLIQLRVRTQFVLSTSHTLFCHHYSVRGPFTGVNRLLSSVVPLLHVVIKTFYIWPLFNTFSVNFRYFFRAIQLQTNWSWFMSFFRKNKQSWSTEKESAPKSWGIFFRVTCKFPLTFDFNVGHLVFNGHAFIP